MIDDDSFDLEALEAAYPVESGASDAADDALILDLIDLIADEDGIVHIADPGFPITLTSSVPVVEHTVEATGGTQVHHYHFENELVVMSESEVTIVTL